MARIVPFSGWRYAPHVYGDSPGAVTAPPYDIIDDSLREALYRQHSCNVVRLILPRENDREEGSRDRYDSVARRLSRWRSEGILVPDARPRMYVSELTFRMGSGPERTRRGFFAALDLEDSSRGLVIAHEGTLASPRQDRLDLIRAVRANLSPIFFLYSDPAGSVESLTGRFEPERIRFSDEKANVHTLGWTERDDLMGEIAGLMEEKKVYIADGHHRYSAAMAYWKEKGDEEPSARFVLGYFTPVEGEGLLILPIHRMVGKAWPLGAESVPEKLSRFFEGEEIDLPGKIAEEELADWIHQRVVAGRFTFAFLSSGAASLSLYRPRVDCDLDALLPELPGVVRPVSTAVLDNLVLGRIFGVPGGGIDYSNNPLEVIRGLKEGRYRGAFLPRAVSGAEILEVAEQGEILPPKTTFFYPKLRSGMLFRMFE